MSIPIFVKRRRLQNFTFSKTNQKSTLIIMFAYYNTSSGILKLLLFKTNRCGKSLICHYTVLILKVYHFIHVYSYICQQTKITKCSPKQTKIYFDFCVSLLYTSSGTKVILLKYTNSSTLQDQWCSRKRKLPLKKVINIKLSSKTWLSKVLLGSRTFLIFFRKVCMSINIICSRNFT